MRTSFLQVEEMYPNEEEALRAYFNGSDIFFSSHTGYRKSLVFQAIPSMADVLNEKAIGSSAVIVVSPLTPLMKDQVQTVNKHFAISTPAIYEDQDDEILQKIEEGVYLLVYTSPEALLAKKCWRMPAYLKTFGRIV